jgi:hypothetical protein
LTSSVAEAQAQFPGQNGMLAYILGGGPKRGLYTVNPDGTGKRRILRGKHLLWTKQVWSPDGNRIAFSAVWRKRRVFRGAVSRNESGLMLRESRRNESVLSKCREFDSPRYLGVVVTRR